MKIILISGKAEAGKDCVAEILKELISSLGLRSIRLAYGDYVKNTAREIWGWDGQKDVAGRALLQWWGTDYVRAKHPSFWAHTAIRLAQVIPNNIDYILVPDVRFPNEIVDWSDAGFDIITVRVERPGHISKLTPEQLTHISETALDDWAFDIVLTATDMNGLINEVREKLTYIIKNEASKTCSL